MRVRLTLCLFGFVFVATGCQSGEKWQLVTPGEVISQLEWSEADRTKDYAIQTVKKTAESSHHFVRLKTEEKPHIHAEHDLTVVVLTGEADVHFRDHKVALKKGDVVEVPRGTYHWAKNTGKQASEVYVIFTPPFNGEDVVLVS